MLRRSVAPSLDRTAFSFAEVMFAVVILGIGFIMVASIFPVVIKQSQANVEESYTAALARNGVSFLDAAGRTSFFGGVAPNRVELPLLFPTDLMITAPARGLPPKALASNGPPSNAILVPALSSFPVRGKLISAGDLRAFDDSDTNNNDWDLRGEQIRSLAGNFISPSDPRFAWVPVYRRDRVYTNPTTTNEVLTSGAVGTEDSSFAQVVVFGVQIRNRTTFDARDLPRNVTALNQRRLANLEPRPVAVRVVPDPNNDAAYVAQFFSVTQLGGDHPRAGYPAGAAVNRILDAAPNAVAEGCYFVIADDRIVEPVAASGMLNGRIYRVGTARTDLGVGFFDLYPGFEFAPDPGPDGVFAGEPGATRPPDDIVQVGRTTSATTPVTVNGVTYASKVEIDGDGDEEGALAFVIGRGLSENYLSGTNAADPPQFDGPVMDVSVYTALVKVK